MELTQWRRIATFDESIRYLNQLIRPKIKLQWSCFVSYGSEAWRQRQRPKKRWTLGGRAPNWALASLLSRMKGGKGEGSHESVQEWWLWIDDDSIATGRVLMHLKRIDGRSHGRPLGFRGASLGRCWSEHLHFSDVLFELTLKLGSFFIPEWAAMIQVCVIDLDVRPMIKLAQTCSNLSISIGVKAELIRPSFSWRMKCGVNEPTIHDHSFFSKRKRFERTRLH